MSNKTLDRINAIKANFNKGKVVSTSLNDPDIAAIIDNIYSEDLTVVEAETARLNAMNNYDPTKCLTAEELAEIEEEVFEDFDPDAVIGNDEDTILIVKEYGVKNGMD